MNEISIELLEKELGVSFNNENMENINKWHSYYNNKNKELNYTIKNLNGRIVDKKKSSINIMKRIAEDLTKLIWSEKTKIVLQDEESTQKLNNVLNSKENNLYNNFFSFVEKTLVYGTGVLSEYKDENGKTVIDYINGSNILPYKHINGFIYGLAVLNVENINNTKYLIITQHEIDGEKYIRKITVFKKMKNGNYIKIDTNVYDENLTGYLETVGTPKFQIFKTLKVNNLNNSPLGISIFANSLDKINNLDDKYNGFSEEFNLGKKRILISNTLTKKQSVYNKDGEVSEIQYFDTNDTAFMSVNAQLENEPIKEINMNLRADEFIKGIDAEIKLISSDIGLGNNYYSFNSITGLKTATEVLSEKSDAYRTMKSYQNALEIVIKDLVFAVCELENIKCEQVSIIFDDSVVLDIETEKNNARIEVQNGLMSKYYYLKNYRNLPEDLIYEELERLAIENTTELGTF